jgi:N-methylhydantoinase B
LHGGLPGAPGKLLVKRCGQQHYESLSSKVAGLALKKGDQVCLQTSGGGGYGKPQTRCREAVKADLQGAYISERQASTLYTADEV